jgi:flavin-dependent dehydrogenase
MNTEKVDLLVIGAGPAGQKGAIQGAKGGFKVVVIDRLGLLGGACLNQGTGTIEGAAPGHPRHDRLHPVWVPRK